MRHPTAKAAGSVALRPACDGYLLRLRPLYPPYVGPARFEAQCFSHRCQRLALQRKAKLMCPLSWLRE